MSSRGEPGDAAARRRHALRRRRPLGDRDALGEAVFYTGMTGYEEALTDPSYAGQILTFTYPLIGNYGVSGTVSQHPHACVAGAVMKHLAAHPSHYAAKLDLGSWLDEQNVRTIVGIDTRALTIALREHGTIAAALAVGDGGDRERRARRWRDYARDATTRGLVASGRRRVRRRRDGRQRPHARRAARLRREARDHARPARARHARHRAAVRRVGGGDPGAATRTRWWSRPARAIRATSATRSRRCAS